MYFKKHIDDVSLIVSNMFQCSPWLLLASGNQQQVTLHYVHRKQEQTTVNVGESKTKGQEWNIFEFIGTTIIAIHFSLRLFFFNWTARFEVDINEIR